jgi:hypothetical protein
VKIKEGEVVPLHAMQECGGGEVELHSFVASAVDAGA